MTSVNTATVALAAYELLRAEMPVPVGFGAPPSPPAPGEVRPGPRPDGKWVGFLVVYHIPSGGRYVADGYCGQPEAGELVRVQVTGVGVQPEQAMRVAAMAAGILVDRDDAEPFEYVHPLAIPGHHVINRRKAGDVPLDRGAATFEAGALVDIWATVA